MGIRDHKADNWFSVCEEYLAKTFGNSIHLAPSSRGSYASTMFCIAKEESCNRCFNLDERTWDSMEDDEVTLTVACNGDVAIGYTLEDQIECGMNFKVKHPREVVELLKLLIHPDTYLTLDEEVKYETRTLGEMATFYALIPDGETWRMLDLSVLPENMPDDFRQPFFYNSDRFWNRFVTRSNHETKLLMERWPAFVNSLPDAISGVRAGYIRGQNGNMSSAVDLAVIAPTGREIVFDILMVPSDDHVSSLYLGEVITADAATRKMIKQAFDSGDNLDEFMTGIKTVPIRLPANYPDQVRIAAENNAIRQWLLCSINQLAAQKDYYCQNDRNWHLAHTLASMLDRTSN